MKKNLFKISISIFLILFSVILLFGISSNLLLIEILNTEINSENYIKDISEKHKLIFLATEESDEQNINENKEKIKNFFNETNIGEYIEYKYENLNDTEKYIFYKNLLNTANIKPNSFIILDRTGQVIKVFDNNEDSAIIKQYLKQLFEIYI